MCRDSADGLVADGAGKDGMTGDQAASDRARDPLAGAMARTALYSLLLSLLIFVLFPAGGLTIALFREQDFPILLIGAGLLLLLSRRPFAAPGRPIKRPGLVTGSLAIALLVLTAAGTWLVFGGFPLTRDEIMADFDSRFLAHGQLVAPVPIAWRGFADALMPQFMTPVAGHAGWLSSYLPGNAALRAVGVATIGGWWVGPILATVALAALYRVGRRLWPETPGTALVPVVLLASSAQVVAMAMTPYAMTAHLALNLLWLLCFLRRDRLGDAGAILAGFVATGLHQLLFHPLFALPFIATLWRPGSRGRAIAYLVAYAAIGLFWSSYGHVALGSASMSPAPGAGSGPGQLAAQALELLASVRTTNVVTMVLNLLRFLSWQNVMLLPLAALGWAAARRSGGIAWPLATGIALTTAAMLLLLPWQGHGWGYRYWHGLIGSFCLLAGYGWQALDRESGRRAVAFAVGTAVSLLLFLPWHLIQAHDIAAPYRAAHAMIARAPADIVIVQPADVLYDDLVRNNPDLSNRPLVMNAARLSDAQILDLCRRYRVARFDLSDGARAGIRSIGGPPPAPPSPAAARRLACAAPLPID